MSTSHIVKLNIFFTNEKTIRSNRDVHLPKNAMVPACDKSGVLSAMLLRTIRILLNICI